MERDGGQRQSTCDTEVKSRRLERRPVILDMDAISILLMTPLALSWPTLFSLLVRTGAGLTSTFVLLFLFLSLSMGIRVKIP